MRKSQAEGLDQAKPDQIGPDSQSGSKPELRGESVVVVKAAEHRACHDLDRAFPHPLIDHPRQAWAVLRYAFDPLMRPTLIVVGDVGSDGATKVVFRQKDEVDQALPAEASHETLDVGSRIRSAEGDGHSSDAQDLSQPEVQRAAVRPSRFTEPAPPELAEFPVVVMDKESGPGNKGGRLPDSLL